MRMETHTPAAETAREGGEPESYRTERLYHRTVLAIPSSPEIGGTNPISSLILAELTRNEAVTFRKSSEIAPATRPKAAGNEKAWNLPQLPADRRVDHARGTIRIILDDIDPCPHTARGVGLQHRHHRRHHVPDVHHASKVVRLDQGETAARDPPNGSSLGEFPLFRDRRPSAAEISPRPSPSRPPPPGRPLPIQLLIPYGVEKAGTEPFHREYPPFLPPSP